MRYEIPYKEIIESIQSKQIKKVAIQLPEGIKRYGRHIIKRLDNEVDKELILSGYPCYGACDVKDTELDKIGVDKIIHLGHFSIPYERQIPTEFFPIKSNLEIKNILEKAIKKVRKEKVGVITTPQYHHKLDETKKFLEEKGLKVVLKHGDKRITSEGLVLGCNFSAAKFNSREVLYIGSGKFHPLGVSLSNKNRVIVADPETNSIKEISYEDILKKKYAIIGKIRDIDNFGILISTKKGQLRYKAAKEIRKIIKSASKDADLIAMDDILPNELINLGYDAYVNTSCPRISIDDYDKFDVPIVTPIEAKIAFGDKKLEEYKMDEF